MAAKLLANPSTLMNKKNYFFHCAINLWNGLPQNVIDCNTVKTSKCHLDKHFTSKSAANSICLLNIDFIAATIKWGHLISSIFILS